MKKLLAVLLTAIMILGVSSISMASLVETDYTNHKVGVSVIAVDVEDMDTNSSAQIYGSYAINDLFSVNATYNCDSDKNNDGNALSIGGRFQAVENVSLGIEYLMNEDRDWDDYDAWVFSGNFKVPINNDWAIAGLVSYLDDKVGSSTSVLAQGEYQVNEMLYLNGGALFSKAESDNGSSNDMTSFVIGFQVYPLENLSIGYDYQHGEDDYDICIQLHSLQAQYNF